MLMKKLFLFTAALLCAATIWAAYQCTPQAMSPTQSEGGWIYDAAKCGKYNIENNVPVVTANSFNNLNGYIWGKAGYTERAYQFHNDKYGLGFMMEATETDERSIAVLFSTYYRDETVPAYTRMKLSWDYRLSVGSSRYTTGAAMYAHNNLNQLKAAVVDQTAYYNGKQDSPYYIGHKGLSNTDNEEHTTYLDLNHEFDFDNRTGSTEQTKSWCLMMTQVVDNNTDKTTGCFHWCTFQSIATTWTYYYYKQVTFNANGGTGLMSKQEIENSGNLNANTFTRNGCSFIGWATSPDGPVVYADGGTVTASENDKGALTLYAKWKSTPASVMTQIESIGTVQNTSASKAKIDEARAMYGFLTDAEKTQVTNYSTLTDAESAYSVVTKIAAIGTVQYTEASKGKIDAARAAYDALPETAKAVVGNYSTLTAAERAYAVLDVKGMINAIGEVEYTEACKTKIETARAAYDALSTSEKAQVNNYSTLTTAERAYFVLDTKAKMATIGEVEYTEACKAKIDSIRAAYETLTSSEKAQLTAAELETLQNAENTYAALEVETKIAAIGSVIYPDSKAAIDEARAAYDALTAEQKDLVTNYGTLIAAEAAYASGKEEETETNSLVVFVDNNGNPVGERKININYPEPPTFTNYTFLYWQVVAENISDGTIRIQAVYEKAPVETVTVYLVNTLDWETVNAYVWSEEDDAPVAWPGEEMTKIGSANVINRTHGSADEPTAEKDVYSYTFDETYEHIIFNNGTEYTANLTWAADTLYFAPGKKNEQGEYEGTWYGELEDVPSGGDEPSVPTDIDETIVNRKSSNHKFIKKGNVYILTDEFIYTIDGKKVIK